jgi:AraC-like DNA-binding protein
MSESSDEDLLSVLLERINLRGAVFAHPTVCGPWQINTTGRGRAQFHLIARGACFLHLRGQRRAQALRAGDLLVLPHDDWHVLSPEPAIEDDALRLSTRGPGPMTSLVCGEFEVRDGPAKTLMGSLPRALVVRAEEADGSFGTLLRLMADEALRDEPGTRAVLDRLSDALFVMVLRHHVARSEATQGLLSALRDPGLARAVAAMHRDPGRDWSLEALAEVASMSRTAFATRFAAVIGSTPMAWLTDWRMAEAERRFRDPRQSIARVATDLGYDTEAAFRRAFKRVTGRSPGAVRRAARTTGPERP